MELFFTALLPLGVTFNVSQYSREVVVARGGPSMTSMYSLTSSMSPIRRGAEFSGSTKDQHAGVAWKQP